MRDRAERAIRAVVRAVGRLPRPVVRVLAGPPHVVDGQRLYPEVQAALRLAPLLRPRPGETVERARARVALEARLLHDPVPVRRVEDAEVLGSRGPVPVRVYQADPSRSPDGVVVYLHGGGFVLGDLDTADPVCRFLARAMNAVVLSVGYALAPEHPFPAALTDSLDVFRHVRDQPGPWSDVPLPVAVAGDSAGGNLAAVVANLTRDDADGGPVFQLLLYPGTDMTRRYPSEALFDGYALAADRLSWYHDKYLTDGVPAADPRVSPMLAEDLAGVAPAHVVVAGFDVLRDEGLAYAARLRDAGVPTTVQVVTGHVHGFANAVGMSRHASEALAEAVQPLASALRTGSVGRPA
ncbi:alpha/beta hydrolase [Antribacter gilvus]|uniref:alpha/beta hydrolase n=1 Tax=Antribacter gilvus TaxID=2304675 RepID=UPI000F78A544|nr:alpha/beta hydrolase [Antribacter gilvus]